ncbi:acyltransferase [Acidocella sp.]|uniref:acyltransferase family protein n=1 Tax=Acidocella sp. TaxID=50710 RepID=UPI002627D5A9|nr:acyltransferase [Acidocella sp.]
MAEHDGRKLIPLEGLRGIAAAIVVLYHLVLAFTPKGVGVVPHGHGVLDLIIQFLLGMLNGGAAVAVFFVLSGFILSLPFAQDRRLSRILVGALKRWPRLAGLTAIGCLFAFALISWSGQDYQAAARIIGAKWLATHGNAPISLADLTWQAALREGLINVFTQGEVNFDSPLWTMRIELFGSFAVFLAAPILFAIRGWGVRLGLVAAAFLLTGLGYPYTYFADFLTGTVLAMLYAERRLPELGNLRAAGLGLLGLYLFSFTYEQALLIHAPLKRLIPGEDSHYIWDAGAALIILVLLGNPAMRRWFSGGWAIWLGFLSFPIYVLHGPLMLSAGSSAFMQGVGVLGLPVAALLAAFCSLALTLLCAMPLAWMDRLWTRLLGALTRPLMRPRAAPFGMGLARGQG